MVLLATRATKDSKTQKTNPFLRTPAGPTRQWLRILNSSTYRTGAVLRVVVLIVQVT